MYDVPRLRYDDPHETAEFQPDKQQAILEMGAELTQPSRYGTRDGSYLYDSGEFGKRFAKFSEIAYHGKPHIRAALSQPEAIDSSDPEQREQWPAFQMITMLDKLSYAALARSNLGWRPRSDDVEARGAFHVSYCIGQIAHNNDDYLSQLARHDLPEVSKPARRLLVNGDIQLPIFNGLPTSLPFVNEVMAYDVAQLNPNIVGYRGGTLLRHLLIADQPEALEKLLAEFDDYNLPPEAIPEMDRQLANISVLQSPSQAISLSDVRTTIQLEQLRTQCQNDPKGLSWEQGTAALSQDIKHNMSPFALQAKKSLAKIAMQEPRLLGRILDESYGIDLASMESAWIDALGSNYDKYIDAYRTNNIEWISTLEINHPGSARYLQQEFRLHNFARYPFNVLARQYRDSAGIGPASQEDTLVNKYLIARFDHNAAFQDKKTTIDNLSSLVRRAGQKLEIHEMDSTDAVARSLLHGEHKIGLAIFHAHNNGVNAAISRTENFDQLDIWSNPQVAGKFAADATVIMESCHTGRRGMMGDTIANAWNVNVMAPTVATSITEFTVSNSPPAPHPNIPLQIEPVYYREADEPDPLRRISALRL